LKDIRGRTHRCKNIVCKEWDKTIKKKGLYPKFDGNLMGNIVQMNLTTHTKTQGKTKKTSKKHRFKTTTNNMRMAMPLPYL
jgi:hypothetical protein